jgi:hypothetical protein
MSVIDRVLLAIVLSTTLLLAIAQQPAPNTYRNATAGVIFKLRAAARMPSAPQVMMQFSSAQILLGEPVWVMVTVHNASDAAVVWNAGDYCFMDGEMPVTAVVRNATVGTGKPERCNYGAMAGDCITGGNTTTLAVGASATWRYLLEGDFHFAKPGTYVVEVTSHPGRVFQAGVKHGQSALPAAAAQTLTLVVMAKDDTELLAREKQMAVDVETEILARAGKPMPPNEDRSAMWRESQNVRQIRKGLAAQPVAGMEAVFEHWLRLPNDFEDDAVMGLKNLNTEASRADLAKLANTPDKPNSYAQVGATYALADMNDAKYYPLMVQLLSSANEEVRRAAIVGVGNLGGDAGAEKLVDVAHTGSQVERNDALAALGNTQSRAAVKALIDLMLPSDGQGGLVGDWPLFVLTHHRLDQVTLPRTAAEAHDAWEIWWNVGGKDAPVYSQFECGPGATDATGKPLGTAAIPVPML